MRGSARTRWLGALACLGLTACAAVPPTEVRDPISQRLRGPRQVAELLVQAEQLAGQPMEDKKRELQEALVEFQRDPADGASRLRLILALAQPRTPWYDEAQLFVLLAEWPPVTSEDLERQVAQLVVRLNVERQRLAREDQRRYETLRDEHRRADLALRENQRKLEELQHKLDALRAIDRDARRHQRR